MTHVVIDAANMDLDYDRINIIRQIEVLDCHSFELESYLSLMEFRKNA